MTKETFENKILGCVLKQLADEEHSHSETIGYSKRRSYDGIDWLFSDNPDPRYNVYVKSDTLESLSNRGKFVQICIDVPNEGCLQFVYAYSDIASDINKALSRIANDAEQLLDAIECRKEK